MLSRKIAVNANILELGFPETCPNCGTRRDPLIEGNALSSLRKYPDYALAVSCFCPDCENFYLLQYHVYDGWSNDHPAIKRRYWEPQIISPFIDKEQVSEHIDAVSPAFRAIFEQTQKAELCGFHEITGPGYRKALEFLVKDYAVHLAPSDKTVIETTSLRNVIRSYLPDKNLVILADQAATLGNEFTHYVRHNSASDIEELKTLINYVVRLIETHIIAKSYETEST